MENQKFMVITKRCEICKRVLNIKVSVIGYNAWMNGELIQRAMPDVSAGDRELLLNSICGKCYDKLFEEEE